LLLWKEPLCGAAEEGKEVAEGLPIVEGILPNIASVAVDIRDRYKSGSHGSSDER
jgi:hypothetical protein